MKPRSDAAARLLGWAASVFGTGAAGLLGGALLGTLLARVSFDYVVIPSDVAWRGLQLGLLAGATVGACQVVGRLPAARIREAAAAAAAALGVAVMGVGAGATIGYAAFRWGWFDTSAWSLPNPSRHALLLGATRGLDAGALLGGLVAGAWLLRRRIARQGVPLR